VAKLVCRAGLSILGSRFRCDAAERGEVFFQHGLSLLSIDHESPHQRSKAPGFMVSCRPSNPVRKACLAQIPARYSPLETTSHKARVVRDGSMSAVRALIAMSTQRSGAAARDRKQHFFVLSVDPLATALNEGLPGTANNVGHLQRRPVHALCVGSPSPRMGSASSGLPVALRWRRERCR